MGAIAVQTQQSQENGIHHQALPMTIRFSKTTSVPSEDKDTGQIKQLYVRLETQEVSWINVLYREEVAHLVLDSAPTRTATLES